MNAHYATTDVARNWPYATRHEAKRMAVKLIRAKQYLRAREIEAFALNSKFTYRQGPEVLKKEAA